MRKLPLVTIGIPTYNRADAYLRATLQSAVSQDYPNLEIVVCDNCSTDHTGSVVKEFQHPGLRYVRHERNIGWLANYNACLEQASGEYFQLLHDDDMIDRDFVSTCMQRVRENPDVGVVRTGIRIIDAEGKTIRERLNPIEGLSNAEFFLAWFRGITPNYLCNTLYNTECLREVGGFNSKTHLYCDDAALFRVSTRYGRLDIEDVKTGFRKHGTSMGTMASIMDWCEDSLFLLSLMCSLEPARTAELKSEGNVFFSRVNYGRASRIRSVGERLRTYLHIYRSFGRAYALPRFLYRRNVLRFEHALHTLFHRMPVPSQRSAKIRQS